MAVFLTQYKKTCNSEGLLSNDSGDGGGLTWKGVSIVYESKWAGWPIILKTISDLGYTLDYLKDNSDGLRRVSLKLVGDIKLEALVQTVYKSKYWDCMRLDECPSQQIAGELFDTAVNQGSGTAVKYLQRALNVLNQKGTLYPDVVADGAFGDGTYKAFMKFFQVVQSDRWITLWKALNCQQGMRYIEIMEKNPSQEKFAFGWFTRVFEA